MLLPTCASLQPQATPSWLPGSLPEPRSQAISSGTRNLAHQPRSSCLALGPAPPRPLLLVRISALFGSSSLEALELKSCFSFTSSWELFDSILSTPLALVPGVNIPLARAATAKDITAQKALRNSLPPCAEKSQLCSCVLSGGSTKSPAPCSSEQAEIWPCQLGLQMLQTQNMSLQNAWLTECQNHGLFRLSA